MAPDRRNVRNFQLIWTTSEPKTQSNFRIYFKRNFILSRNSRTELKQEINNNEIKRNKRSSSRARVCIQILFHFDSYFIYFFTRFWFLAAFRCLLRFFFIYFHFSVFVCTCLLSNSETMCECAVGFTYVVGRAWVSVRTYTNHFWRSMPLPWNLYVNAWNRPRFWFVGVHRRRRSIMFRCY